MELSSHRYESFLEFLKHIYEVSQTCKTRTYIWGGLVPDILSGNFLRDHNDIDGFALNLWDHKSLYVQSFEQQSYTVSENTEMKFIRIERDGIHAVINELSIENDTAIWHHAGPEGSIHFPAQWLKDTPKPFYDTHVFISGLEFEYAIKTAPYLLNPAWALRENDVVALNWLEEELSKNKVEMKSLLDQIWSDTPYWFKKGYKEYSRPVFVKK